MIDMTKSSVEEPPPAADAASDNTSSNKSTGANVEDLEMHKLVDELALLTGDTQTDALTKALRERLKRVRRANEPGYSERLLEIGRQTAPLLTEPHRSINHGKLLYDEMGLPK